MYHQKGELRRAITLMRRAYPQHLTAGRRAAAGGDPAGHLSADLLGLDPQQSALRGLDPYLIAALIAQESTFDPKVRSVANAWGLMQIVPATGRRLARTLGIRRFTTAMLTNAEINIRLGTLYFSRLVEQFGGTYYALASYNAGESRVVRWKAERPGLDEDEFIDDIPFPETQNYVKRILGTAEDYRMLYGRGDGTPRAAPPASKPTVSAPAKKPAAKKPAVKKKAPAKKSARQAVLDNAPQIAAARSNVAQATAQSLDGTSRSSVRTSARRRIPCYGNDTISYSVIFSSLASSRRWRANGSSRVRISSLRGPYMSQWIAEVAHAAFLQHREGVVRRKRVEHERRLPEIVRDVVAVAVDERHPVRRREQHVLGVQRDTRCARRRTGTPPGAPRGIPASSA